MIPKKKSSAALSKQRCFLYHHIVMDSFGMYKSQFSQKAHIPGLKNVQDGRLTERATDIHPETECPQQGDFPTPSKQERNV